MAQKIAIIGAGSFGTSLAFLLGEKGIPVSLWARRKELADEINAAKHTPYLPGVNLPATISASSSLEECMDHASVIVLAIPSPYLREILRAAKPHFTRDMIVMHVIKGIDDSGKLASQVLAEELPFELPVAVLSGPNHAEEISRKLPTATVIASHNRKTREHLCNLFTTPAFKTYPHDDVIGVEICGAVKNIVALAMGVCDGLEFGDNAKGSILTLGLAEMGAIAKAFGAKRATCFGLAGVGDLVATCFSKHSRNRFVGEMIAQGKSIEQISREMHGMVAEGVRNTRILHELCKKHNINAPLIAQAHRVLYEKVDLKKSIDQLLTLV